MASASADIATIQDLRIALDRFATETLEPLFERTSLKVRTGVHQDIKVELQECSQECKDVCRILKHYFTHSNAEKPCSPAGFPQSGQHGGSLLLSSGGRLTGGSTLISGGGRQAGASMASMGGGSPLTFDSGRRVGASMASMAPSSLPVILDHPPDTRQCPIMQLTDVKSSGCVEHEEFRYPTQPTTSSHDPPPIMPEHHLGAVHEDEIETMPLPAAPLMMFDETGASSKFGAKGGLKEKQSVISNFMGTQYQGRLQSLQQYQSTKYGSANDLGAGFMGNAKSAGRMTRRGRAPSDFFQEAKPAEQRELEEYVLRWSRVRNVSEMAGIKSTEKLDDVTPNGGALPTADPTRNMGLKPDGKIQNILFYIKQLVLSDTFDYCAAVLIVVNAIVLGVQTDYMARSLTDEVPLVFQVLETLFAIVFTLELLMRILTFRFRFFFMAGWKWNLFDSIVVGIQLLEEFMARVAKKDGTGNYSFLRMLRILRLVRIVRLVRVLRLIGELRTIVVSVMGCMRSLFWTMLLLLLMMYMIGVYLTQLVSDHKKDNREEYLQHQRDLDEHFGSLGSSVMVLFQSITNGISWRIATTPLMEHISPWLSLFFCMYICFALLAMMNVVTGVFVESSLANAKRDKESYLLHHARSLFQHCDSDGSGDISWEEFHDQLDNPDMKLYFDGCGMDSQEAENLFVLLDVEQTGSIVLDDFVKLFFKLHGNAKAIDLAMLSYNMEHLQLTVETIVLGIEDLISRTNRDESGNGWRQTLNSQLRP